ncbi:MAG: hypothetical protein O9284_08795 [Steroidobacteraceae bacterium]|nr:hypothetical protein [Steroidobacteraceae bacterium]
MPAAAPAPARVPTPTATPRHAWLALRLPALALEVVAAGLATPVAVLDGAGSRRLVVACNAEAARRGVRPGLAPPAARALVPDLETRERDPAAEERRLQSLARWAVGFTPSVSPEPPDTLLLEVRGSLRLFGGAAALVQRATHELRALGHAVVPALAPTPRAALWLSRVAVRPSSRSIPSRGSPVRSRRCPSRAPAGRPP